MQIIPGWHPIIVHFAIAMTVGGGAALATSRLCRGRRTRQRLAIWGTFNLCAGAAFVVLAIATGIMAIWDLNLPAAARAAVSTHVKWAFLTAVAVILAAVWRGAGAAPEEPPSNLFLAVMIGAVACAVVTAYFGAENVYRFGIGVLRAAVGG
jgi:uncharacterized membrane protein